MLGWLRRYGGIVNYVIPPRELPTRPVDPDLYARQLDDEIAAAAGAGDLAAVDALTAERGRILLARGES